jgi:hypothetical protein
VRINLLKAFHCVFAFAVMETHCSGNSPALSLVSNAETDSLVCLERAVSREFVEARCFQLVGGSGVSCVGEQSRRSVSVTIGKRARTLSIKVSSGGTLSDCSSADIVAITLWRRFRSECPGLEPKTIQHWCTLSVIPGIYLRLVDLPVLAE